MIISWSIVNFQKHIYNKNSHKCDQKKKFVIINCSLKEFFAIFRYVLKGFAKFAMRFFSSIITFHHILIVLIISQKNVAN